MWPTDAVIPCRSEKCSEMEKTMERWGVAAKRADFNEIGRMFSIDPVIALLIRNRDVV